MQQTGICKRRRNRVDYCFNEPLHNQFHLINDCLKITVAIHRLVPDIQTRVLISFHRHTYPHSEAIDGQNLTNKVDEGFGSLVVVPPTKTYSLSWSMDILYPTGLSCPSDAMRMAPSRSSGIFLLSLLDTNTAPDSNHHRCVLLGLLLCHSIGLGLKRFHTHVHDSTLADFSLLWTIPRRKQYKASYHPLNPSSFLLFSPDPNTFRNILFATPSVWSVPCLITGSHPTSHPTTLPIPSIFSKSSLF
jgi:hypothetical protein